jgi:ornithine carbamoyltransferase
LIRHSQRLKALAGKGPLPDLLAGKSVVAIYEQNSTRTRVSFDLGVQRLGGASSVLESESSQLARGETLEDTALVLSRYADAIVYRARSHEALETLADHATVPVVNALTEREHPCQVLADLTTLHEHLPADAGPTPGSANLAYVGDGNNMCHSYLVGGALAGLDVRVAVPPGYQPSPGVVAQARRLARAHGGQVSVGSDPDEAVQGADAVATDTWISMGDEAEHEARLAAFEGYTVDEATMEQAAPNAVFLHCLPGHWGHEATEAVAHGPDSVILDEAENRLWTQMALLSYLLEAI